MLSHLRFFLIALMILGPIDLMAKGRDSFFEPYVGATIGNLEENITNVSGVVNGQNISRSSMLVTGDFSGFAGGLKVYKKYLNQFIIGGDLGIGISSGKLKLDLMTSMGSFKIVTISPGLYVGWDMPTILLPRIWAGFYPLNSLHLSADSSGSSDSDKYSGHSFKFGFSFDWWIQVNFEYAKHTYTKIDGKKFPYTTTVNGLTMTQEKLRYDEIILTLSYPFGI